MPQTAASWDPLLLEMCCETPVMRLLLALPHRTGTGLGSSTAALASALAAHSDLLHGVDRAKASMAFLRLLVQLPPSLALLDLLARYMLAPAQHGAVRRNATEVFLRTARRVLAAAGGLAARESTTTHIQEIAQLAGAIGGCYPAPINLL